MVKLHDEPQAMGPKSTAARAQCDSSQSQRRIRCESDIPRLGVEIVNSVLFKSAKQRLHLPPATFENFDPGFVPVGHHLRRKIEGGVETAFREVDDEGRRYDFNFDDSQFVIVAIARRRRPFPPSAPSIAI